MDIILSSWKWQSELLYQNDIDIFPKSSDEHVDYVLPVLTVLNDAGVTVKLKKISSSQIVLSTLVTLSSHDALRSAHIQSTQFAANKHRLISRSYALSLACAMSLPVHTEFFTHCGHFQP